MARNAPFADLGAPRACQSVVLSVHTAKTRHSGRMYGRKTARERPVPRPDSRDRILIRVRPSYSCIPTAVYIDLLVGIRHYVQYVLTEFTYLALHLHFTLS